MRCELHQDKEAVKFCGSCGSAVCEDCLVNAGGTSYCKNCYAKKRKAYNHNNQLESIINEFTSLFSNKIALFNNLHENFHPRPGSLHICTAGQ